jgi:hypothetical protein
MEGSKKTPIMIAIIIVCLVLASVIIYRSCTSEPPGSVSSVPRDMITWMVCRNQACGHEYTMNMREYLQYQAENIKTAFRIAVPMTCEKCGEESAVQAVKCGKCGDVFEEGEGSEGGDFSDRCPKCGHSKREEDGKRAAEARKKG